MGGADLQGPEHGQSLRMGRVRIQVRVKDRGRPRGGLHQVQEGAGPDWDARRIRLVRAMLAHILYCRWGKK